MAATQAVVGNRTRYLQEFAVLSGAAVGVVVTKTRDPYRAMDALREYAGAKGRQFYNWTMLTGWAKYDSQNMDADPTIDNEVDPFSALKKINAIGQANPTQTQMPDGIYTMTWPHFHMKIMPPMLSIIAEYSRQFAEQRKRLVLLVPMDFDLPTELDNSVTFLDFDPPASDELHDIFNRVMQMTPQERRPNYSEQDVARIISAGQGTEALEFENALSRAVILHRDRLPRLPIDDFLKVVLDVKTETIKKSEVLELMPTANMALVGGLDELKAWVDKRKHAFTPEARAFGVDKPRGVLLVGPPGTGKSLAAKAMAYTLGVPLIKFDIGRVFNSLVGSSEARVRAALKLLNAMAPCAVLLDELDKMFNVNSGGGDSGVGQRILGAILTFMQENQSDIFWVASANRVEGLPSELVRKGRLDEIWSVTTPNEQEREQIFGIHLRSRGHAKPDDIQVAVEKSAGFVGSEIEAAVAEAILEAFHQGETGVTGELIAAQLELTKPLSRAYAEQFQAMETWAASNARAASSAPVATAANTGRTRTRAQPRLGGGGRQLDTAGLDG